MSVNHSLMQTVHNELSYCLETAQLRAYISKRAGMLAPVEFYLDSSCPIQPYAISPWWNEQADASLPTLLKVLRGDFFCAPFGGNDLAFNGVQYPPHGESANNIWELDSFEVDSKRMILNLVQEQTVCEGRIQKMTAVLEEHQMIYQRHEFIGMSGPMDFGHHPCLHVPEGAQPGWLSFSPHRFAHTYIDAMEHPQNRGYSILKPNTPINDLTKCPMITGETTDLTRYPARRGFEDLVMLTTASNVELGWTAFSLPELGYVWFSLKDPKTLPSTILWLSNGGRHFPPWNGRHTNTIGLEEIMGFFHEGITSSARQNFLNDLGISTCVMLNQKHFSVNFIQGVVRIDKSFTRVASIEPIKNRCAVRLTSVEGQQVETPVCVDFLQSGQLDSK